ncbi:DSPc-domain-containing protein [Echria macrotheca]|uniref:protein-tyrosine-phosphatase n=1 Tax=Echria macrotheca TaxID=438768 RepID=A0AAJ0F3Q2_9PEZI|nr:DSPc-domain-containing protein [Echria macrotheca]
MSEICDFIDQQTEPPDLLSLLEQAEEESMRLGGACIGDGPLSIGMEQGKVLVHCTQGVSRSPTVVIAYLMRKQRRGFEAVYADVKVKRREIEPSENFVQQLRIWEEVGYEVWEDKGRTKPKRAYQAFLDKTARMVEEEDEGNYHGGW